MKIQLKDFKQIVMNDLKRKQGQLCYTCHEAIAADDRVVVQYNGGEKLPIIWFENLELVHERCIRSRKERRKDQVLKLKEEGLKLSEIATKMGISITSVYNYLKGNKNPAA